MSRGLSVAIIAGPRHGDGVMQEMGEVDETELAMHDAVDGMFDAARHDDREAFFTFLTDWHRLAHSNDV